MAAEDGIALQVCLLAPGDKLAILRRILVPRVGVRCHQLSPGRRTSAPPSRPTGLPAYGALSPSIITIRPWKRHGRHLRKRCGRWGDAVRHRDGGGNAW